MWRQHAAIGRWPGAIVLVTGLLPHPVWPQQEPPQELGAYFAEIGREDLRNSRGERLQDLGAILRQDRANVHRFGIRHGGDEVDPFFVSADARAAIPGLYASGRRDDLIERMVLEGNPLGLRVFVCGEDGRPVRLVVEFADGDFYRGCN